MAAEFHEDWNVELGNVYWNCILGQEGGVADFDTRYRMHFLKIIRKHLHPRLRSQFDAEDLLQEFYQKIFADRNPHTLAEMALQAPVLRRILLNIVLMKNRSHLDAAKRDVRRERHVRRLPERLDWDMAVV